MKQLAYILSFGFLGIVIATLLHGVIELLALDIIFGNPAQFADTIWWTEWRLLHGVFSWVLWVCGLAAGLYAGKLFWHRQLK